MKKYILLTLLLAIYLYTYAVPPCPEKKTHLLNIKEYPSQKFTKYHNEKNSNVPDSILIIMTDFTDIKFRDETNSFDGFDHNEKFFKKYMQHLSEYWFDASHGKYNLQENNYYFYDKIVTLSNTMAFYGNDEHWNERISLFFKEIIEKIDEDIDFRNFDSIIIFHAGAGQETDISGNNSDDLWTTFITRKSLQDGLDPDNDNFAGIETNDGIYVKEAIIMPESEIQPDYEEGSTKYGMLGVLAHEFGHLLGLPTLFDNYSSNGRSAGIGNFGVMGTGVWNANGFVPPLPCAWSRYFMGWEDDNLVNITKDTQNCDIAYPMMNTITPKLYKINISPKEYFLLENRQQNPDNSTIHGFPNFTFPLLPDSLQEYYPPPNDDVPVFNFMTNSYAGCEWDFFLPGPGYGEPPDSSNTTVNGSGLFIWHIDEYMIDLLFTPDFEMNYINYDASHKGVDLEEASGYQYLDTYQSMDSFGTPYASYREGNNTYFGLDINPFTGLKSLPTSKSYYGGENIEIYDISSSSNIMNFSVRFAWNLNPDYTTIAKYPPLITKFDNSDYSQIINVMPDGHIFVWNENEELDQLNSLTLEPIVCMWAFDKYSQKMILPYQTANIAAYYTFSNNVADFNQVLLAPNYIWATNPIVNNSPNSQNRAFLPVNNQDNENSIIYVLDNNLSIINQIQIPDYTIVTNMMIKSDSLYAIFENNQNIYLGILDINHPENDFAMSEFSQMQTKQPLSCVTADFNSDGSTDFAITTSDSLLYLFDKNGKLFSNFPVKINLNAFSLPSVADVDGNGNPDILIGGENSFLLIDKSGNVKQPYLKTPFADSLCTASGVLALDTDSDGKNEVIGNFSKNRLVIWSNKNNNDFVIKDEPTSLREKSPFSPLIAEYNTTKTEEGQFIFVATNNGLIFRKKIEPFAAYQKVWYTDLANYQRTASYDYHTQNGYSSNSLFVKNQTYIYPNPLSQINSAAIFGGNRKNRFIAVRFMINTDAKVEMKYFTANGDLLGKSKKNGYKNTAAVFYIDANQLSSGVYYCTLKCKNKVKKLKFVVEK